jgi:hypothetical protein
MGAIKAWKVAAKSDIVNRKCPHHHIQVVPHSSIHTNTDARIGNHHIGHALALKALLGSGHDAVNHATSAP